MTPELKTRIEPDIGRNSRGALARINALEAENAQLRAKLEAAIDVLEDCNYQCDWRPANEYLNQLRAEPSKTEEV
jgi:hypothetical protein